MDQAIVLFMKITLNVFKLFCAIHILFLCINIELIFFGIWQLIFMLFMK